MSWKNVWIVGASTGIGRELAIQLGEKSEKVVCSSRSVDKLSALESEYSHIQAYAFDAAIKEDMRKAAEDIYTEAEPLDLVVYNAGIWKPYKSIEEFNSDDVQLSMDINYMGAIYMLEALLPK